MESARKVLLSQGKQCRRNLPWLIYGLLITAVIFWMQRHIISSGFWTDDFDFIRQLSGLSPWQALSLWAPGSFWCYRPVFLQYWWAGFQLWGVNAAAFHFASIILHLCVLLLLAWLGARLSGKNWLGFAAGIMFLFSSACSGQIPPFSERSVNAISWISSVSTLWAACFSLLTFHCWISYRATNRRLFAFLSLAFVWLALCSKEDAFSLPFALMAVDFLIWRKRSRWILLAPVAMAALFAVLDIWTDRLAHLHALPGAKEFLVIEPLRQLRLSIEFNRVIWNGLLPPSWLWGVISLVAIGWMLRRHRRALALGCWALLAAFPVPFGVGTHAFATRFYYYPAMVFSLFAVIGIWTLLREKDEFHQFAGIVWLVALAATFFSKPYLQPEWVWAGLIAVIAVAILYGRENRHSLLFLWWIPVLAIGSQLLIYGWDISYTIYMLCIIIVLAGVFKKRAIAQIAPALLAAVFALPQPLIVLGGSLILLMAQSGKWKLRSAQIVSRCRQLAHR